MTDVDDDLPIASPGYIPGPEALKALTHPLRLQLLDALAAHGRATASRLAADLGETSGATSYHLRQLARHGFIEEIPGAGTARERWWQPVTGGWTMPISRSQRAAPVATVLAGALLDNAHHRALEFLRAVDRWPKPWQQAAIRQQAHLALDPARLKDLQLEVEALLDRYRDLPAGPQTRRVRATFLAFPVGDPDGDDDAAR